MLDVLDNFYYPKNCNRHNIRHDPNDEYRGFALGIVKKWVGGHRWEDCRKLSIPQYKILFDKTTEWFNKECPEDFKFTTIQYNKNYKCKKHIDGKNVGESYIVGLGDYTGGELIVYDENDNPTHIDIKNKFYKFNGSKYYHETAEYTGTRYTLVFFSVL